ncbi:hypothetical protein G9A89_001356 [Geosiphon pyriformis]|nr:hypothetical protein G9A89_001356 [Geosiphon pyriformis]
MDEIPGYLISVHLLFKNKLSVMVLGLYAGVSISTWFSQAADINSMISKAVNASSFVVLSGNFNENESNKSASFKFCLGLSLVNTFNKHSLAKAFIWSNSKVVEKVIDFILVSGNLAFAMTSHFVDDVSGSDMFEEAKVNGNLNTMWKLLEKAIVQAADTVFSMIWYNHLVVDNELVIESNEVKLKVDKIIEGWTRKRSVLPKIPDLWAQQYMPLNYVDDNAFSGVIVEISIKKLFLVVNNLLNDKTARSIALVETALLKDTLTQFPIFAIGLVVKNALEKNKELWFVAKSGRIEASKGKTSFLAAGAFVDNTIWGLSKPSLAQAHKNIRFFSNIVLRKAITDKQFCYLVLAVLQPIINYHTQFSFITLGVCCKAKAGLLRDFSSEVLHYSSLYGLKPFKQVQSEGKLVLLISFSNGYGIFEHLFNYRILDLQVLKWFSLNFLQFPVRLHVSSVNNFLAGVPSNFLMSGILDQFLYYKFVFLLKCFGVAFGNRIFDKKRKVMDWKLFRYWKQLDPRSLVLYWFSLMSDFMNNYIFLGIGAATATKENVLSILDSDRFFEVYDSLLEMWSNCIKVYIDGFLRCASSVGVVGRAATYFPAADMGIGVRVTGLLFSTLAELQAVVLVLECVSFSCSVVLYSDSQSVIDVCISEAFSTTSDFHNQCWVKRLQIANLLKNKNISIKWVKVKEHSDVLCNIRADVLANETTSLFFFCQKLPYLAMFIILLGTYTDQYAVPIGRLVQIWDVTATIWHPNSHMLFEFTSRKSANLHMYLMKAVYRWLPVAVKKKLYSRGYPGVLCLLCSKVEFFDHVFTCSGNSGLYENILVEAADKWMSMSGLSSSSLSAILLLLSSCSSDVSLYIAVCQDFGMKDWFAKAILVEFIRFMVKLQHTQIWTVRTKHKADMKKADLVGDNSVIFGLFSSVVSMLLAGVVHMFGVIKSFAIKFGRCKLCYFFSGLSGNAFVTIGV